MIMGASRFFLLAALLVSLSIANDDPEVLCREGCHTNGYDHYYVAGTAPFCDAQCSDCPSGYATCEYTGASCVTGVKQCCCYRSPNPAVENDPHFTGLNGEQFEFVGLPNTWFNLVTSPHFQFNAYFEKTCTDHSDKATVITRYAFKFPDGHVYLLNATDGGGYLDGVHIETNPHKHYLIGENGVYGSIFHKYDNFVDVSTPAFVVNIKRVKVTDQHPGMVFYGKDCKSAYYNLYDFDDLDRSLPLHGLLGQTAHHGRLSNATGIEGQGEIEGTYKDYIVSGPTTTDFKFNLFED